MSHNNSSSIETFAGLRSWLEDRIGYDLDDLAASRTVIIPNRDSDAQSLLAIKIDDSSIIRARPEWTDKLHKIVNSLTLDELFSVFGAYELARITLADNISVWGPSWYFFGNEANFAPAPTQDVTQLSCGELNTLADPKVFWHCDWQNAVASFGITNQGTLVALATVHDRGSSVYEFGVDVLPTSGRRGLGQSVVSAAGQWILEQGGLILATTAPWNIPSARLLRSIGLRYVLCDLVGQNAPFRIPPQPLGKPLPDTLLVQHYPAWAMTSDIKSRDSYMRG